MSLGGLDLGYWKGGGYWAEGWRPDDFSKLSGDQQAAITEQVEAANGDWSLATRLVAESLSDEEKRGS